MSGLSYLLLQVWGIEHILYYTYHFLLSIKSVARYKIFLFFTNSWQLNGFSSHTIAFNYVKLVRRLAQKNQAIIIAALHCYGNSNSCVQIKSCENVYDPSYSFYHKFGRHHFGLGENIPVSHQNIPTSKEIEVNISYFQITLFYTDKQ